MPSSAAARPAPVTASPRDDLASPPASVTRAGSRANARTRVAGRGEARHEVGADRAGGAGDEDVHLRRSAAAHRQAQNVRKMRELPGRGRSENPRICGQFLRKPSRILRHLRSAALQAVSAVVGSCPSGWRGVHGEEVVQAHGEGSGCREEGFVRGLLLQVQSPLCARPGRAVRHVPAGPSRRSTAAAPAAVHLPPGAAHPGRVGVPHRAGAGRAAALTPGRE